MPKALKSDPKSNKSPNLVTLIAAQDDFLPPASDIAALLSAKKANVARRENLALHYHQKEINLDTIFFLLAATKHDSGGGGSSCSWVEAFYSFTICRLFSWRMA